MLKIDGTSLRLAHVRTISRGEAHCELDPEARVRVAASRQVVEEIVDHGQAVYGINTGFGNLARVRIDRDNLETLQERLILSHAAGVGDPLPPDAVRVMLAFRANTLARGHSGVRPVVIDTLLAFLRHDLLPKVPSRGSVGASGDLAPLAHLALPLIGRGRVCLKGEEMETRIALQKTGIEPLVLGAKEGLALINGTQAMTALLSLAVLRTRILVKLADLFGALSTDALRGTNAAFDPRLHALRAHPGQITSAANLWALMEGSAIRESHREDNRVQDPYCVRCMPQVHGAVRDVLDDVARKVEIEMNSVTDNPLVFPETHEIISGGNFHGETVAIAGDQLAIAVAELGSISERRIEKLTNTSFSGLPPFLTQDAGLNSGFMIAQVTAAALASENKGLCHPASVDSIPTSADKEDHVSMGMWAALKLLDVLRNTEYILGIEWLAATQGLDLLRPLQSSEPLERLYAYLRESVGPWDVDREMAPDIATAKDLLRKMGKHIEDLR